MDAASRRRVRSSNMPGSIPQEIKDEIVNYLWNERDALKSCSLSCRAFVRICQKNLFKKIILRGPWRLNVRWPEGGGSVPNFKQLLDASPHIATYVKCLELFDHPGPSRYNFQALGEPLFGKEWLSRDTTLHLCLPLLCNLQALVINYRVDREAHWRGIHQELMSSLAATMKLPSLIYVDLADFPIATLDHGGSNLKHVAISMSTPRNERIAVQSRRRQSRETLGQFYIESLSINCPLAVNPVISRLLQKRGCRINVTRLKKLVVQVEGKMEVAHPSVWRLLQACAETLEDFVFIPCLDIGVIPDAADKEAIDPGQLKSLRKLTLFLLCDDFSGEHHDSFPWLIVFLEKFSSTNRLEELTIHGDYDMEMLDPDISSWMDVTEVLLTDRFPSLKKLRIEISAFHEPDADDVFKGLEDAQCFALLNQKGLEVEMINMGRNDECDLPLDPTWVKTPSF